jgi:putative toxin-antitoxin system antitoxin component (TIGR02293 family)
MSTLVINLLAQLKDPTKEVALIRKGLSIKSVESFLDQEGFVLKDILPRLGISSSTYFSKKKKQEPLDVHSSEKLVRLIQVMVNASRILGDDEAKKWVYQKVPSLGNKLPIDLLDTEVGHQLVEQALLQIEHGIYG